MAIPITEAAFNLLGFFTVEHTLAVSIFLVLSAVALYAISWAFNAFWAWFDDALMAKHSWVIKFNCKLWGYRLERPKASYPYSKDGWSESQGDGPFIWSLMVLFIVPFLLLLMSLNLTLSIVLAGAVVLAFVARGARRYSKLFNKHVKDKDAH